MSWRETTVRFVREILRAKTIRETIAKELREAHLRKLEAESAVEYARSIVVYNEQQLTGKLDGDLDQLINVD